MQKKSEGMILVVDDDKLSRTLHRSILAKHFDVVTASSGAEALKLFDAVKPSLVLMDAVMPEMDGYEVSAKIRERSNVPIIFVTGNTSLQDHLRAYDSGCTGLLTKPVNAEILTKKALVALERYNYTQRNEREKQEFQKMAMNFLSSTGQSGVLMNFMRTAIASPTYEHLAKYLLDATNALGLDCVIRIEHGTESTAVAFHGAPTLLELSILENASEMGRVFQFKNRLVVNFDRITIVVSNAPADHESNEAGTVRDNIAILAETTQAMAENIDTRCASAQRAEQMQLALSGAEQSLEKLRENQAQTLADVQILQYELIESVEKSFGWLGTSQAQEDEISRQMQGYVRKTLDRLHNNTGFEEPLEEVIQALRSGYGQRNAIELF